MVETINSHQDSNFYLGIDFGTSGARAIVINADCQIQFQASVQLTDKQDCNLWQTALFNLLESIPAALRHHIQSIAINGTSSTVLLCDQQGQPLAPPLLYNDSSGAAILE
ncbi:hypothetical protein C7B61_16055, partial [filamentous cyanobacterium CCP1]